MADHHEHGTMSTEVQEKTFASFVTILTRVAIVIILTLVFIALVNG